MKKPVFKNVMGLVIILALFFTLSPLIAQQKTKIAGKHTFAYTKQNTINIGDIEGHVIMLDEFEGVNVSTGKNKFMDGAQEDAMGFYDLVMGNGPTHGYGKMSLNGDVVFWKHQGMTATTPSPEGKPVTTFEGSFTWTKGAGKYENIKGSGSFKGMPISRTIFIIEWEGEYFIKK